jgi:hypothetical protein
MNDSTKKPVALNLMEIWVTGRQMERVRALWRACNRDNSPATEWRPMNPGVAKKALRSGVFTVTFEGVQSIFCAREFPRERLQIADYARLKLLNEMAARNEALPPLVMPAPVEVPNETLPGMEAIQPFDVLSTEEKAALADEAVATADAVKAEKLDAAADAVIADITTPRNELEAQALERIADGAPVSVESVEASRDGDGSPVLNVTLAVGAVAHTAAPFADAATPSGDSPTSLSDGIDSLATDGGVSIPSVGNTADATTEATHEQQQSDGGRESDRGSEVQGND